VPQCVRCGERLVPAQLLVGDGFCQPCRDWPPEYERAASFGEYEHELRELIHLLKYERVPPASKPLGRLLAESIQALRLKGAEPTLVVPVPLHSSKRRERGFNQAELIARSALKQARAGFELKTRTLVRKRATRSQVGLDREARIANLRGAFKVVAPKLVAGRTVLLVDDVMTTGATLSECARALKQAGAAKVFAATVARALKPQVRQEFGYRAEGEEIGAAALASV
jgi:ComF family protein